jgi:hypothetical protein
MEIMEQVKSLQQSLDDVIDWLSDLPEDEIRVMFRGNRIPRNVDFTWTIGGTEYIVTSHFKPNNAEAVINKVLRLLEGGAAE